MGQPIDLTEKALHLDLKWLTVSTVNTEYSHSSHLSNYDCLHYVALFREGDDCARIIESVQLVRQPCHVESVYIYIGLHCESPQYPRGRVFYPRSSIILPGWFYHLIVDKF